MTMRESFIRNNLHNGVVSGAARGQALLGPMWAGLQTYKELEQCKYASTGTAAATDCRHLDYDSNRVLWPLDSAESKGQRIGVTRSSSSW